MIDSKHPVSLSFISRVLHLQHGGYFDTHLNNVELECGATLAAQLFPDRLSHSDFRQLLQRQENGKGSRSVVEKVGQRDYCTQCDVQ